MRTMCSRGERLVGSAGTVGEEMGGPMGDQYLEEVVGRAAVGK